jgi:hypothetical protein
MTKESGRPILEDGRPVMRDVRSMWRKMQVVAMDRDWDMRCQNKIHDVGTQYTTQGSPERLRIHRRHKRLETIIGKEHRDD